MAKTRKQKREHISEHFVDDLVDNLLVRLPTKSLLRFQCVSKAWHALITSSGFRKKHLMAINSGRYSNNSNDGQRIILSSHRCVQSINFEAFDSGGGGVETSATTLEFPLKHSDFKVVGSCNGLLCLVMLKDSSVVVWNPCIGEYKTLSLPQPRSYEIFDNWYGFGYDPSSDDYKVLRIVNPYVSPSVDILSLKTETWKRSRKNLPFDLVSYCHVGTFVDGVIYWISKRDDYANESDGDDDDDDDFECFIIGFDLKDEKFEVVKLPKPLMDAIHLGVFQGRLCLVGNEREKYTSLWVLMKNDGKQIWTKLMRISHWSLCTGTVIWYPMFFARNDKVLTSLQTEHANDHIEFRECRPSTNQEFEGKHVCLERIFWWQFKVNFSYECWRHRFQLMTYIETLVSPNLLR